MDRRRVPGFNLSALFKRPEPSATSRNLARMVSRLEAPEFHVCEFPEWEREIDVAEREGVVKSLAGAWSYENDGWFRLTKRGRELAA